MQSSSLNELELKVTDRARELAEIIGRSYWLFDEIYPDKRLHLNELVIKTGKDPSNLSKLIKKLEKKDIVETKEVKRKRGRPFKYIWLNSKVAQIISSIQDAAKPTSEPKYDPIAIDLCLDMMENRTLPEKTRILYADSLHRTFGKMPQKILNEHKRLRKTLEEVVKNPPTNGEIEERKRSLIKSTLPRLIITKSTIEWVLKQVYPNALRILEDETRPENILSWAISMLEDIALRCPDQGIEIKTKLREMYFNETIKQKDKVAEKLKNSILEMYCQEAASARELANYLMERAKSQKKTEKEKAILLLNEIVNYLPRYDSIT